MATATPLDTTKHSDALRRWNDALYKIQVALDTSDIAAYNSAQAERQRALSELEQVEQAAFVSVEAAQTLDLALLEQPSHN
tara:strand:- start:908 stop:1150 length:243 start_codon:yes stop_codon:yes gene_type:complete